jgi:hypothetical protein
MDMKPRTMRWAFVLSAACAISACGDRMLTEPQVAESSGPVLATTSTSDVVRMLKRTERLDDNLSASAVIGPRGGHLQIKQAGIRIDFAPGAVSKPTRISVTAIRGRNVAYRFQPHGLVFNAPVTIQQNLRHTIAWKDAEFAAQLQGSYFDRLLVDPTETYARNFERRAGRLRDAARVLEFNIEHFSGYMVSTGKAPGNISVEVEITR